MAERINQSEFARREGVNKSTVSRWIKSGRIQTDENGLIDPEKARRRRHALESPEPHHQARKAQIEAEKGAQGGVAGTQPGATGEPPLHGVEKIGAALKLETYKLQKAKAEKAQMEADEKAGSLLNRKEVEYVLAEFGSTLRNAIESLPDRLSGELAAHNGDTAAIHRTLEEAGAEVLQEIADLIKRKMENIAA